MLSYVKLVNLCRNSNNIEINVTVKSKQNSYLKLIKQVSINN